MPVVELFVLLLPTFEFRTERFIQYTVVDYSNSALHV